MKEGRIERAGIEVEGVSVGGIETCLHVPTFRVAFDVGRCLPGVIACPTVLFTHGHVDHLGAVAQHCATRALRHMKPPTYVLPPPARQGFDRLFEVWRELDGSDLPYTAVSLAPGERHELSNELVVDAFAVEHRGPCQGYSLSSRRRKLKPELRGLPEEELRRLRVDEGAEITHDVEVVELAFSGDCLIEALEENEAMRTARLLILECTFVDDRVPVDKARGKGHVHLDEIAPRAELFQNEVIVMTHFSSRYLAHEIVAALDAKLPPDLRRRVTPLLNGMRP